MKALLTLQPLAGHPQNLLGDAKERRALSIDIEIETNILDAASRNGFLIATRCGGIADCMTCYVKVVVGKDNLSPVEKAEREVLDYLDAPADTRLACQAKVRGEVTVDVPDPADADNDLEQD